MAMKLGCLAGVQSCPESYDFEMSRRNSHLKTAENG